MLLALAFLSGCGEDLRPKVAELEAQLAKEKAALASTSAELAKEKAALASTSAELAKEKAALASTAAELSKEKFSASATAVRLAKYEEIEAVKAVQSSKSSNLTVQIGITMLSGETKAVTNEKVYLVRSTCSEILGGIPPREWGLGMYERSLRAKLVELANTLVQRAAVATSVTDFSGTAVFEDIQKGYYLVICATALGGGAVLEKGVMVSASKSRIALSSNDILH